MIKTKKLNLAREILLTLSSHDLQVVQGGATTRSAAPVACEPSGVRMCPKG
jgi:hypothetical protein